MGSGFGMYGLLPAFSKIDECKVVGICGRISERMQRSCKEIGLNRYTNWIEMLQKENPNAIAIAVIPTYQYQIAKYSLENKIAVFAEKPLTSSLQDSQELDRIAKKMKLPNMIDFIFPEIPEWQTAKKIIDKDEIGGIYNVKVDWNFLSYDLKNHVKSWKTDVNEGGGALSFYFSHVFYYLEYFIGRIKSMQCNFIFSEKSLNKGETGIDMSIEFENGCKGKARMDIGYEGLQKHRVEFQGESGTVTLENNSCNFVDNFELIMKNQKGIQKIKPTKVFDLMPDQLEDPRVKIIKPIAERFIRWCNTGVSAKPDFQDGLRIQELIEMARDSNSKLHKL